MSRALLRAAEVEPLGSIAPSTSEWLASVATLLGQSLAGSWSDGTIEIDVHVAIIVDEAVRQLKQHQSLPALAVLAPHQQLSAGTAAQVQRSAHELCERHLRSFCGSVLRNWADQGIVRVRS